MEIEKLYDHLFGEEYYKCDVGSTYDLNVIKDVCILFKIFIISIYIYNILFINIINNFVIN